MRTKIQGLWKFVAYGDVTAAMNALPRAGETLSGAWTRQDLLYESDTEALAVNPLCISKKESEFFLLDFFFFGVLLFWVRSILAVACRALCLNFDAVQDGMIPPLLGIAVFD